MKRHPRGIVFAAVVVAIVAVGVSLAVVNTYEEYFTTTQYKDALNTTALWDTVSGELKLPPFEMTWLGQADTPGISYRVFVSGNYAYVADVSSGLRVVDISVPTSPSVVGTGYDTPGSAYGVTVWGDYAYVADGIAGLQVINVANPLSPSLAGTFDTPGSATQVTTSGDYAYVADGNSGLLVIDISDPTNPSLAGSYDTTGSASDVVVSGDLAYVCDGSQGLKVLDISNPLSPALVGSYDTPGIANSIVISSDYAFVADRVYGLQVIDISDPANPMLLGNYDTQGDAYGVAVSGDCAYIADESFGLAAIDVTDPTSPMLADTLTNLGLSYAVAVCGDVAFVGCGTNGVQLVDIADRVDLTVVGSYDPPGGGGSGVVISGDYAYVAHGNLGFYVIDITDPTSPAYVDQYNTPGSANKLAVSGNYAYIADGSEGLRILDISDPGNVSLAGIWDTPDSAHDVAVSGDYAYVADANSGLQIVDITDPTIPSLAASYDTPGFAEGVAIWGDYAYVADRAPGLQVIDITDPTNPALAGSYDTPGFAYDLAISGDYAYVADYVSGLTVVDISDPRAPTLAGGYDTPGAGWAIAVEGDLAFLAGYDAGFHILDITDPTSPLLVDSYDPGFAYGIAASGDYAYGLESFSGLHVMWIYQRFVDTADSTGQSVQVDTLSDSILAVKLFSAQSGGVIWEMAANADAWQPVVPDGSWHTLTVPGNELRWRSTHTYTYPFLNPTCTNLRVEWLYASPMIKAITDVPVDQGRQVRIEWTRSANDAVGTSPQIVEYAIYRQHDPELGMSVALPAAAHRPGDKADAPNADFLLTGWDYVMTAPAEAEDDYSAVVPTLNDSTIAEGMYYSTFLVRARTATPGVHYDSAPEIGYSVDNLEPAAPTSFAVAYNAGSGNALSWDACPNADFDYFKIYRSTDPDFTPTPEQLVETTTSTSWNDPGDEGWNVHYKVSAVDFSGNESAASSAGSVSGVDDGRSRRRLVLYPAVPNPFNPSTRIDYVIPQAGTVSLVIYDVRGTLVRTLVAEHKATGPHTITWDGRNDVGHRVGSDTYFCRLQTAAGVAVHKLVLVK